MTYKLKFTYVAAFKYAFRFVCKLLSCVIEVAIGIVVAKYGIKIDGLEFLADYHSHKSKEYSFGWRKNTFCFIYNFYRILAKYTNRLKDRETSTK